MKTEVFSQFFLSFFIFYVGFLSRGFTNHRTVGEGAGYFFNSSLTLPPVSQVPRHQPGDCCTGLTSAHSQQSDSNREPLVSKPKSLTTKLCALKESWNSALYRTYSVEKRSSERVYFSKSYYSFTIIALSIKYISNLHHKFYNNIFKMTPDRILLMLIFSHILMFTLY